MNTLAGKVAIVTGAGRGIGREHALALARAGARVVVNDRGGLDILVSNAGSSATACSRTWTRASGMPSSPCI